LNLPRKKLRRKKLRSNVRLGPMAFPGKDYFGGLFHFMVR
jgi:hypothetical protein